MRLFRVQWALMLILTVAAVQLAQAENWITVEDMVGREVRLQQNPDRLICLGPGTLRLIIYLQGKHRVVGVEDIEKRFPTTRPYWIANSDLGDRPSIGPGGPNSINKMPDLEAVLSVNPQVIFISYMEKAKADELHETLGIPVVVLSYGPFGTFDELVYDSLRVVGKVLAAGRRAEDVISFIEGTRRDLLERVEGIPETEKPRVYVGGVGFKGTHGIESTETIYAPLEWVRATNIAKAEGKRGHLFVDKEKILAWNPDLIFIDAGGNDLVRQDYLRKGEFYHGLKAFREGRVYLLHPFNWYMTNIGTVITDAFTVGKTLHPERFEDIDLGKQADEVYAFLLGSPVYDKIKEVHGHLGSLPSYLR